MRVIAGEFKGRALAAVPGKGTRPTTDKVKESIFSMIGPYFSGGIALDLYAGTGGLGIEALSRGVERVIFVDADAKAVSVIKGNLEKVQATDKAEVYRNDAARALKALTKRDVKFSVVFLDPPYAYQKIAAEMAILQDTGLLADGCWIVAEHDAEFKLGAQIADCVLQKQATYGDTTISIYRYEPKGEAQE
ncbi:16S rRNA (guanine(966)-N(2))-methyltransferase RsmD [Brevibacillus fluminis]|uniref:16S rRNA (guanine(966)-N(2))-methyltransferase RsmD n=1 Tax=Brevibacillus fluminis TaxID=511487 RepID=UPI003F8BD89C